MHNVCVKYSFKNIQFVKNKFQNVWGAWEE